MMIHKINPSVNYNYWLVRLKQQIEIRLKSPKLLIERIRKRYYKTFGASVINTKQPIVPSLPGVAAW